MRGTRGNGTRGEARKSVSDIAAAADRSVYIFIHPPPAYTKFLKYIRKIIFLHNIIIHMPAGRMTLVTRRSAPARRSRQARQRKRFPTRSLMYGKPTVYDFKRQLFYENLFIVSTGVPVGYAFEQKLSQLTNSSEFTNLFDQYMIKKIVVKLIPKITQHNLATTTTGNSDLPQVHSVIDYDDATTPTSLNQLVEYQSYKMTRGNQVHTRTFVPRVELSAGGADSAPKPYQWIDCDSSSVNHRGMKVWFNAPQSTGVSVYYDMLVKVYFSCKNVL